jgi:NADH-quinone oxidoreductase subunit F
VPFLLPPVSSGLTPGLRGPPSRYVATVTATRRLLDAEPVPTLDDYAADQGGRGLEAALRLGPQATIDEVEASGLRGRGGAGFPTGKKWRTVAANASPTLHSTVVVNASEGEPGAFKDRTLLRLNPYRLIEGALIAAHAVGADGVVFALKASFTTELQRLRKAISEAQAAGWSQGVDLFVVEGPSEYLYGEETALLEVIDGRQPFPRIAPPYRHGIDDVGEDPVSGAAVVMAGPDEETLAPPTLVNNVETLANVPWVLAHGAEAYRTVGTAQSPGTVLCTVTGSTRRHGVGEFAMGTPMAEVIEAVGGGPAEGRVVAVLSGVAHPLLPGDRLDTPVSYEDLDGAGSGLGAAGFIVFDESCDLVAVAHGVSRFLAVESCGQCTPCKQGGLAIAELLDGIRRSEAGEHDLEVLAARVATVSESARCYLAHQHQRVVGSLLSLFPDALRAHLEGGGQPAVEPVLIAPIVDISDGRAQLDESHRDKQPDWTYGPVYSGQSPADRMDQRLEQAQASRS